MKQAPWERSEVTKQAGLHTLWERISAYQFDAPGVERTFEARLAQREGWSEAFTRRAIAEYRRFVFLAATTDQLTVPSNAVDAVWHQHLEYTREYAEGFCAKVLGRMLHHTPSSGGAADRLRHRTAYLATLGRYRDVFGELAPTELWPRNHLATLRLESDSAPVPSTSSAILEVANRARATIAGLVGALIGGLCWFDITRSTTAALLGAIVLGLLAFKTGLPASEGGWGGGEGDGDGGGGCGGGCG